MQESVFVTIIDKRTQAKSRDPIGLHPEVARKWIESGKAEAYKPPSSREQKSKS